MEKTYYDLNELEKKGYKKEFVKTPGGRDINIKRILLFILAVCSFGIIMVIDVEESLVDKLSTIWGFLVIILAIYEVYFNISFVSWLKNKYGIKRW